MTKSRKRMLLSSVAMLLVALIALGSATFAWYYVNSTVTASTTKFSATAATGLVIRHADSASDTWTDSITDLLQRYEDTTTTPKQKGLAPASITYSGLSSLRGGKGTSGGFNSSAMSGEPSYEPVTNGNYFLVDSFYVASASATDETATMTAVCSAADTTKYLNLAIYVGNTLTKVITWDSANEGTVGKFDDGQDEDTVVISDTAQSGVEKASNSVQISTTVPCPPKGGLGSGTKITVIGFADGFNSKCKSSSVDTDSVTATFSFRAN